ncbi:hypothetical protein [Bacillus paralicheniformis]|uniref:hypothetical protein n=1 Tax=Bacillus paralicheniformis TaxID=1648923 RepID=UPI001CC77813|nr:hypothetical protein [Bacillus paralicheniformis]UAY71717.1 hypothetical protein K8336_06595 [Bacillus paralicheniformis]
MSAIERIGVVPAARPVLLYDFCAPVLFPLGLKIDFPKKRMNTTSTDTIKRVDISAQFAKE